MQTGSRESAAEGPAFELSFQIWVQEWATYQQVQGNVFADVTSQLLAQLGATCDKVICDIFGGKVYALQMYWTDVDLSRGTTPCQAILHCNWHTFADYSCQAH